MKHVATFVENGHYCLAVSGLFDPAKPALGQREWIARVPCEVVDALPDDEMREAYLVRAVQRLVADDPAASAPTPAITFAPALGVVLDSATAIAKADAYDEAVMIAAASVGDKPQ